MKRLALLLALAAPAHAQTEIPEFKSAISPEYNDKRNGFAAPGKLRKDVSTRSIVFVRGGRWPDPSKIDVCWVNSDEHGEIASDLQNWVTSEYRRAGIGFNWQGKCQSYNKPSQIRVYLRPDHTWKEGNSTSAGGGLSWIGPVNDNLGGVECPKGKSCTMNVIVSKDVVGYGMSSYRSWIIETTRATAVHEFGHALGLAHEQERTDAPICQDQRGTLPSQGDYLFVGQYDRTSIMNYCQVSNSPAILSDGDIQGLKTLYPQKLLATNDPCSKCGTGTTFTPIASAQPAGSYTLRVRTNNLCIDTVNGMNTQGTPFTTAACTPKATQALWYKATTGDKFTMSEVSSNMCYDVAGASKADGAVIQLHPCNGSKAQEFKLKDVGSGWVSVTNEASKKCLTMDGRTGYMTQTACSSAPTQSFGFFPVDGSSSVATKPKVAP